MRFTCGNCGRAYLADDRIQRLAFKMPCRSCGQIISVAPGQPPAPGNGASAGGGAVGPDAGFRVVTGPAPPAEPPPVARKGRLASLVVVGVVLLVAASGVAWYLAAPASRGVPPQVSPAPASAPVSVPAPAPSPSVEAPARPAEPAATVQTPTPEVEPLASPTTSPPTTSPPAVATRKAEAVAGKKPATPTVAASVPATSASAPASPATPGPGAAAIPARPPRPDLPPLDAEQIQSTLAEYAGSFDTCVAEARRDEPDLLTSPRPVVVTMTVRPSGQALYPTLDDAHLSGTALGACVKRQSERMVFPESGGEPVRVRMPLVLGR